MEVKRREKKSMILVYESDIYNGKKEGNKTQLIIKNFLAGILLFNNKILEILVNIFLRLIFNS